MPSALSDIEIQRELASLPGWSRRGGALTKSFDFADFAGAMRFVNRIAETAERSNHHPDLDIRYTKVSCHLSTHSAGGITRRDVALAAVIDSLVGDS